MRRRPATTCAGILLACWSSTLAVAVADGADVGPSPLDSEVVIHADENTDAEYTPGTEVTETESDAVPLFDYEWLLACSVNYPGLPMASCAGAQTCAVPVQNRWVLWRRELPDGNWSQYAYECYGSRPATPYEAELPTVTPAMVEEAVRRMGLPALPLQVQPTGATLVNFDTIFYARPKPFDRSVILVGFDVRVLAAPVAYGWSFGDGAAATTSVPGAPYPAKDVVHRYSDAHVTVQPSVDVTYEVRYSVNGGQMQTLDTTLTAEGPPTGLRIREATPLLAGAG